MRALIVYNMCAYQTLSQCEVLGSELERPPPHDGQDKYEVFGFPYTRRKLSQSTITMYIFYIIYVYIFIYIIKNLTNAFKTICMWTLYIPNARMSTFRGGAHYEFIISSNFSNHSIHLPRCKCPQHVEFRHIFSNPPILHFNW